MKALFTLLLFCLLALVNAKAGYTDTSVDEPTGVCAVQHTDEGACMGTFTAHDTDRAPLDMRRVDGSRLVHHVGASFQRMHRFASDKTLSFIKALLRKKVASEDNLVDCHVRFYDDFCCIGLKDACEHYIYGMRRILI